MFKIKRKLHPKYPDYIPALKIVRTVGDAVDTISYHFFNEIPIAVVKFKIPISKRTTRSYKYNGNTWVIMGEDHVQI